MFGVDEDFVARNIDAAWEHDQLTSVVVTPQLERFLAAMAWKILSWDFRGDVVKTVDEAFHAGWAQPLLREFLTRRRGSVPVVEHHLFFPPPYEGPRRGVNTFYRASILATLGGNKSCSFTLAALGGYLAITVLNPDSYNRPGWNGGTRADPGSTLYLRDQEIASPVFDRTVDEIARQGRVANNELSKRQRERTIASHNRNREKLETSKAWIAMQRDRENRRQFGPDDGDL